MAANEQRRLPDPEGGWEVLVERLAAIEHERWSHWQRYVHEHCERASDGGLIIPAHLVQRWSEQIATPYEQLSDAEKESDRDEVRRYLPFLKAALGYADDADTQSSE